MNPKKKSEPTDAKDLATEIAKLTASLEEEKTKSLRALADLENFRRREAENRAQWSQMAVADFLQKFLPNFLELSLGAGHSTDENIKKVIDKFFAAANEAGIQKIDPSPGEPLDPEQHEVLMVAEGSPGKIVQVLEPGWKYLGKVLVAAKVSAAAH